MKFTTTVISMVSLVASVDLKSNGPPQVLMEYMQTLGATAVQHHEQLSMKDYNQGKTEVFQTISEEKKAKLMKRVGAKDIKRVELALDQVAREVFASDTTVLVNSNDEDLEKDLKQVGDQIS